MRDYERVSTCCRARFFDNLNELARSIGDQASVAFSQRLGINQVRADAERCCSGLDKIPSRLQRYATRRHKLYLRQWSLQVLYVRSSSQRACRKDLDQISAGR